MRTISVINYKGGVGKTTLTLNLAAEMAFRGRRVLLVDLDPQTSLTFSLFAPDHWERSLAASTTIKAWFDALIDGVAPTSLHSLVVTPRRINAGLKGRVDVIASHLGLINVDLELATELGGSSVRQAKAKYLKVHRRLAVGLGETGFEGYDVVLIDCPPNFNVVTKAAIVASDHVLIPAKPDYLSTLGIDYLLRNLNRLINEYNEYAEVADGEAAAPIHPTVLGVVFTMMQFYDGRPISALRRYINQTAALGVPVFENYMRENKSFASQAGATGVPLVLSREPRIQHIVSELEALTSEFIDAAGL